MEILIDDDAELYRCYFKEMADKMIQVGDRVEISKEGGISRK